MILLCFTHYTNDNIYLLYSLRANTKIEKTIWWRLDRTMSSLSLNAPDGVAAPLSAMDALSALLASPPLPQLTSSPTHAPRASNGPRAEAYMQKPPTKQS